MPKLPDLTLVTGGHYSTATLTANFTALRNAFELFVSRDAEEPNFMLGDLDMNSNDILNVGELETGSLRVNNILINDFISENTGNAGDINNLVLVRGDILYYSGTAVVRLPIGTAGQVLKVDSDIPAWGEDTDTVGVNVEEDGLSVRTDARVLNFISNGRNVVRVTGADSVDIDLEEFVLGPS